MTLNITIVTERSIYQSADYRLTDLVTGKKYDDARNQKIFVATGNMWIATICFNGIGRTATLEVSDWVSHACNATTQEESLDEFLARLQTADSWLSTAPPESRRHSFIVAAFVGGTPIISLVSNYERFDGPPAIAAANRLSIHQLRPTKAQTFVSGQSRDFARPRRRALATLAAAATDSEKVFAAMARANQDVARHNEFVSASCFTTYIRRTGEAAGQPHEINIPADLERAFPIRGLRYLLQSLPNEIDLRGRTLKGFAISHVWPSDEYHAIQLKEKPESPDTYSNYGAYLLDKKGDIDGAERAYRKALVIDPVHVNALGNLANVMACRERIHEAHTLYRQALAAAPGQENASYNYANFLRRQGHDLAQIHEIIEAGIQSNSTSGRLHLLLGEIHLLEGCPDSALAAYQHARSLGADQAEVEAGYAVALHVSGAAINECIGAYRTAIALNPIDGALRLNIAQLLFAAGLDEQAGEMLRLAWQLKLGPSSQLEAHFYSLSHIATNSAAVILAIRSLLEAGAELNWNVDMTIERVRTYNPARADLLIQLRDVLVGNATTMTLAELAQQLSE